MESINGTMLGDMPTTRGRVPVPKARSGGRALKQERVPELRFGDVSVVRTRGRISNLRVLYAMASSSPYGFYDTGCGRKYRGARMQPRTRGPEAVETKTMTVALPHRV